MIRAYDADRDCGPVIDIFRRASELAHPFLDAAFLDQAVVDVRDVYLPKVETWVWCDDTSASPVAFISLIGTEVAALFALPDHHGRGIGRALMDHAVLQRGARSVVVFRENPIGRRFYAAYGFRETGAFVHEESGQPCLSLILPEAE